MVISVVIIHGPSVTYQKFKHAVAMAGQLILGRCHPLDISGTAYDF